MKKKIIIATSLVLAIAVAVFGLFTYQHHQKQEKATPVYGISILINFWRMVEELLSIGSL